jgi:HK97 family phage portal protein
MEFKSTIGESIRGMLNQATSGLTNPASWMMEFINGSSKSSSGISITLHSALGIPEVWNGVSKISGAIAGMPLLARKYDSRGYGMLVADDAGSMLWRRPNEVQTTFQMVEKMMIDAILLGNGRLLIERDKFGRPVGLIPLSPYTTQTLMVGGDKFHYVSGIDDDSAILEKDYDKKIAYTFRDEDVIHVMNLSTNGIWGLNTLEVQKDNLGLSLAGMEAQGVTYRHSGRPNLILTAPRGMFRDADDAETFMEGFRDKTSTLEKRGRAALLREGMSVESMSTAVDSESTDSRRFQRESTALILLLESIIGDNSGSAYGSLSQRNSAWLQYGLGRWLNKIEQECTYKLMSESMRRAGMYYDFSTESLWKADREGTLSFTQGLRTQGVVSTNEVRMFHNLPPVEDPALDSDFYAGLNTISMTEESPEDEAEQDVPAEDNDTATPESEGE